MKNIKCKRICTWAMYIVTTIVNTKGMNPERQGGGSRLTGSDILGVLRKRHDNAF